MPTRIVIVEDYTQLPEGILGERGETGRCPACKRIGVFQNREGKTVYFHRLSYEIADGEKPKSIYDTCSL
jgi:hypothetical protein